MLFPQFSIFSNKRSFNYIDINNLLIITINLRETWNYATLKNATHNTWITFKDKVSNDQKIILREAIIQLRLKFTSELTKRNSSWLSSSIVNSLLELLSPSILTFHKRKSILDFYSNSLTC